MTGEDWNQPPEGVAEIMLPQRSITSTWVVSPRRRGRSRRRDDGRRRARLRDLGQAPQGIHHAVHLGLETRQAAGRQLMRRLLADQPSARRVVVLRQQALQRHIDERWIAVIGLAVSEASFIASVTRWMNSALAGPAPVRSMS